MNRAQEVVRGERTEGGAARSREETLTQRWRAASTVSSSFLAPRGTIARACIRLRLSEEAAGKV